MAGEIFFKSGSKSSITTEAPLTPSYKAGTVYFAIDDDNNGFIYLDYDNKRIPMTSVAEKASNDSADHSIVDHYVHSITSATNTLTYKDGDGDQLGTASIINSISNAWTNGTTAGPTIQTTVNGVSGSAVAIPSAGASASGIVTTGAQTFAGSKTFSSKIIGNLQGNADTATSATNDSSSHKIADWYVHSIAHSNNTLVYKDGDGDSLGSVAIPGAFFVKGTQTASTNTWTGALPSGVTQYYEGLSIAYFLPYAGTSSAATLNLGGLGAKPVILGENATGSTTTHYAAKNVIWMTYLTDSSVNSGNGYWKVSAHRNSTYYSTTAYCGTAAGTAAKSGSVSYYTLQPGYIPVMFIYTNSAQSALTLNINSTGAKPLYINGAVSSSSNYTIPRDVYMVYYDGTNYYLRTDGIMPGKIERAIADGNGNEILTNYASSLALSGNTLTLKSKNDDALSTVTIAASDTKVNVTLDTTSKAYVLGTTTAPTATAAGVTSIADTGVYLGTTAGELVATKFTGDLAGNASTATLATKATGDANGNPILSNYASSLESSGNSLVLKAKNGDTLSTVTVAASDTKVNVTLGTTSKAYILGTTTTPTATAAGVTSIADTGVYLGTTAGELVATKFTGDLAGNAATATLASKATGDANGNPILSTYAGSLEVSGRTLTLKAKNGDTLSTVTTQDNDTKNTAGSTNSTSKLFLIGATSQATNPQTYSSSKVYVTDGTVTATTFSGDLSGNATSATTATSATYDSGSNEIESTYIKSISYSGNSATNAAGTAITAGSAGLVTMLKGDDTPSKIDIPAATASVAGLVNNGSQTWAGTKTFSTGVTISSGTSTKAVFNYSDIQAGTSDSARPVWFAWAGQNGTPVIDNDFTYNPSSNTLTATNFNGLATKATGDAQGNPIISNYASSLTLSGSTLTLKSKNDDILSQVTIAASDTKVNVTLGTTSKAYILGTTTTPTSTATGVTSIADTGVYLGTTAGELVATKFTGDLNGNAATATLADKATGDGQGDEIRSKYASSLEVSGTTLTLKAKNGDQLSQVTTQDTKNTAGSSQKATKIYIIGAESQGDNPQTYSSSKVYITDGTVTATTFSGALSGNASTATLATKATGDGQGNEIYSKYASSLSSANNTLTLKAKNGDILSTPSIVNSIGHTWAGGTTAGPTLYITVNGQSSTASAIPSASASASGIVTTGDQSFAGIKTFTGNDVVISKTGPDPASTPVTFANRTSYPSLTFKDDSQYGSFIMTRYDSVFKPGVTLYFRSDQTYANFIASYLKAEEGLYAKYANTLITGGSKTAAVTTSPYVPEKWTFNTTVSPANGDIITIETPGGGHDYGVFLSIKDGDYYPIVLNGTGRLTTHYPQGTLLTLIFDSDQSATSIFPVGGGTARTTVTGGAWRVLNYYDSGNPGDWNLRQYTIKAASAITAVHAIGGTDSGYKPIDTGNAFDIRYAVMYAGSDIASAGTGNNNYIHHYSINLRNSSNSNISFTAYKNVYIKGTISGTTFTPYSTTNPYVQDITASDDGYVYYYIGRAYSTSAMTFDTTGRDIFVYKNGAIRKYSGNAENANYVNLYEARGTTTNLNKAANYVGAGAMFHLVASSSTTTGKCSFDANVLQMNWDNNGGYDSQLAISTSGSRMQIRSQASAGTAWREVVTTAAATETGSGVKPIYISNTGAVTASSSTAGSAYVPIYLNAGTLTQCSNPSMLVNLGSTSAASVFAASPRPGITGVLGTANGGTGSSSFTALRAIYTESATKLSSSGHYMNSSKFAVNSTSEPSYNLYINGTTMHNGDIYQISLNGQRWREHFYEATAGTSALGSGTQTFTVKGGRWGEVWYEYPRLTTTYATAGDATSTSTTATSGGIYYWRQWSYNSSTADRLSYYENFYLPSVTKDRTGNASYEIFTSKSYTTLDGRYVKKAGDTMTGQLNRSESTLGGSWIASRDNAIISCDASNSTASTAYSLARIKFSTKTYAIGSERAGNNFGIYGWLNSRTENGTDWSFYIGNDTYFHCSTRLYGAVWNDYAEYRRTKEEIEPGRVVLETGFGDMKLSDRRLQPGANITTDTFGFAIGETEKNKTPIAVSGRVLAYPYESIDEFKKHIGGPVCSGPDGTVSIMSIEEERMYPSRIIGTVSEIPDYEEWGTENIKVNGRIWIRVR